MEVFKNVHRVRRGSNNTKLLKTMVKKLANRRTL
jgi:hypothetical protein